MKNLIAISFVFFITQTAFAGWQRQECQRDPSNPRFYRQIPIQTNGSFDLRVGSAVGCTYNITKRSNNPTSTINYSLGEDGSLYVTTNVRMTDEQVRNHWKYAQLISRGMTPQAALDQVQESDFHSTGSKIYYFQPRIQDPGLLINSDTGEIKMVTANGLELHLDERTGLFDETQTTDVRITQSTPQNGRSHISITSPNAPLITLPYNQGGSAEQNRNANVVLENNGRSCDIAANRLFNYEVSCVENSNDACSCNGDYRRSCIISSAQVMRHPNGHRIQGRIFNDDLTTVNRNISSSCSGFGATTYSPSTSSSVRAVAEGGDSVPPADPVSEQASSLIRAEIGEELYDQANASLENLPVQPTVSETDAEADVTIQDSDVDADAGVAIQDNGTDAEVPEAGASTVIAESEQTQAQSDECLLKLQEYFQEPGNLDIKNNYIKIQGEITLHRLAWTYLKATENNTKNIEEHIGELLSQRNSDLHTQFINTEAQTRNQRLNLVMLELKDASQTLAGSGENEAYALQYSDVKMVDLLAEAERLNGRTAQEGVMDFLSIIKNSLKNRQENKAQNREVAEAKVNDLLGEKTQIEEDVADYLESVDCERNLTITTCEGERQTLSLADALGSTQEVIDFVYQDQYGKQEELKSIYQWNTYWLRVSR